MAPRSRDYTVWLDNDAQLKVEYTIDRGGVQRYSVVLTAETKSGWTAVRVWDNTHGLHDMHRCTLDGKRLPAQNAHNGTPDEALRSAVKRAKESYRSMIDSWQH